MSDGDAHYFEDGVARGGALVTVKADARASEAMAILQRNGADLGSMGGSGTAMPAAGATAVAARPDSELTDGQALQLKAERLSVD